MDTLAVLPNLTHLSIEDFLYECSATPLLDSLVQLAPNLQGLDVHSKNHPPPFFRPHFANCYGNLVEGAPQFT